MTYRIEDFYSSIDKFAPFTDSESWDNSGLLVGSPNTDVKSALVALDLTNDVLNEAKSLGANLIITHHPVIYPSLKRIDSESLLHRAIREDISVISAHTNYDRAQGGVNDALATLFELCNVRALESTELPYLARIGELVNPMTSCEFALFVKQKLNAKCVKYTLGTPITYVAVGCGSCAELWESAFKSGAQALVTAEVKHHFLLAAQASGFTLIDAGHFTTEIIAIAPLAERISQSLPNARIFVSKAQGDPACYA